MLLIYNNLKMMNMKWLKERSAFAMTGAVLAIIICTLCVIFSRVIPAVVITTLSVVMVGVFQEIQVYFSNKTYEFDWLNVGSIIFGGALGIAFVVVLSIL